MKKVIALLFALSILSVTACSDKSESSVSESSSESSAVTEETEEVTTEAVTEPPTEPPTEKTVERQEMQFKEFLMYYYADWEQYSMLGDDINFIDSNGEYVLTVEEKPCDLSGDKFLDYIVGLRMTTHSDIVIIEDKPVKMARSTFSDQTYYYDFVVDNYRYTFITPIEHNPEANAILGLLEIEETIQTEENTKKATEPPAPSYSFEAFTLSGTGDTVLSDISIPAVYNVCSATHDGSRNFIVHFYDCDDRTEYLINEIGTYNYSQIFDATDINDSSSGMLEVQADGNWSITFSPVQSIVSKDTATSFSGTGSMVTGAFKSTGNMVCNVSHDGDSNFIIHAYELSDDGDKEYVVNEIGAYSGQTVMKTNKDTLYFFNVEADGNWTITIE